MKRYLVLLIAVLCSLGIMAPSVVAATDTSSLSPTWQTWEQQALSAVGSYRGHGPVTPTALPGPVSTSSVSTADGVVSVQQETIITRDDSGAVLLDVAVLGSQQVVVTEYGSASNYSGTTLVLRSGSTSIAGTYPLASASTSASTAALRHPRHLVASLVTIGGCFPAPQRPTVIGSTFGPLVQGEGTVRCTVSENLAAIVSLYVGATHVGTSATGSDTGTTLAVNSYFGCSSGGPNTFHTAELYSVNGIVQGGATSTGASLGCQS